MKIKPYQVIYVVVFGFTLYYAYNYYYAFETISTTLLQISYSENNQSSEAIERIKTAHFKTRVEESTYCKFCDISLKCQLWTNSNTILQNVKGKTSLRTNEDKFLLPWLYNGPFNQLSGFRQSAYLAISLNRTLVLPIFTKHFTDGSDKSIIDANYRFDVANIASILPIVTFDEYAKKCGKNVDVIFAATNIKSKWAIDRFHVAEKIFGIELLKRTYLPKNENLKGIESIKEYPVTHEVLPSTNVKGRSRFLIKNRKSAKEMYGSKKKCAMYAFPFNELDLKKDELVGTNSDFSNVEGISDKYLFNKIVDATQVPEYISEIAKLFIQKQFGNNSYHAMHWRFDKDDFFEFMCQPNGNGQKNVAKVKKKLQEKCDKIFNADPATFPYLIRKYLSGLIENNVPIIIYIATPSSTLDWLFSGIKTHQKKYNMRFYTSRHVIQFLRDENIVNRCDFFKENLNDIISLIDMELCIHGQIFFRSLLSSWSNEVMNSRKLHRDKLPLKSYDIGIFDVITNGG